MSDHILSRRSFIIGTGAAIAIGTAIDDRVLNLSAPEDNGLPLPASVAVGPSHAAPDYTVLVIDRDGEPHLVGAYGTNVYDAVSDCLDMLAEEIADDDIPDDGWHPSDGDDLDDIGAETRIARDMWIDDCRMVRAWPGYHTQPPAIEPVHQEGDLEDPPAIGAKIAIRSDVTGTVVAPFERFDDIATVSIVVPASSGLVRPGSILLRPAPWGRMAIGVDTAGRSI